MTFGIFLAVMLYLLPVMNFTLLENDEDDFDDEPPAWLEVMLWPLLMALEILAHIISVIFAYATRRGPE